MCMVRLHVRLYSSDGMSGRPCGTQHYLKRRIDAYVDIFYPASRKKRDNFHKSYLASL
jgi:hypothetical protein